jgi:hypothetical protein
MTTEDLIKQAVAATSVLMLDVTEGSLSRLMLASQLAESVYSNMQTRADCKLNEEEFATLSKQKYTEAVATADAIRRSRLSLNKPRDKNFFSPAQDGKWTVSNPSSPFLGLGTKGYTKGCGGPNVVQPLVCEIDDAPLNVVQPDLCRTVAALREAKAACAASLLCVLEAYAVLIKSERTTALDPECKSVMLKLLEVFLAGAGNCTAEYGFEVISVFQGLRDATFPWPHFQQMLRILDADKVATALRLHFDTAHVHAALQSYCKAQACYAVSMAEEYTAKFVPLESALIVAESMQRACLVIDIDDTLVYAASKSESNGTCVEFTWEPDADTMQRYMQYKEGVDAQKYAHLQLSGTTATSTVLVSDTRMQMFDRLLRGRAFRSVSFASANNDGRTYAMLTALGAEYEWVRGVAALPRSAFMLGNGDARDQKKSIAAIRTALGVPEETIVIMVDDKASEVIGACARDALVSVRPFAGNDVDLDATEEERLEREIAETAAPAYHLNLKRKRDF